jgi:guanylate kinase
LRKCESRLKILNNRKGKLFVIAAPSGAGKSSLIQSILINFENIELSISATTRSPRKG